MKKIVSILLLLAMCLTAFAACNKGPSEELIAAGDYLYGLYKDESVKTPSDYDVAGRVMVGTTVYTVDWTVDVTEGVTIKESEKAGFVTIDVNEKTETDINYKLTATIKDDKGDSVVKSFERTVPAYKVFSYAEYAAAEDDATVVVKGIITGIFSKTNGSSGNGIYIQDLNNEGGYYVYGLVDSKDPEADLGLKVGMTIEASGLKDTYNGLYEIVNASIEILDETIKTVEPVDYTDVFANAQALNDEALVGKQSLLVTIKGVEITGQDLSNGYYKFALGGKETYVRISSSNNCITKDEQETFKAAHTDNFGYVATVTGIVQLYNGNIYLIPATVDAFTGFALPERSDAEKVEMEVGNITLADRITENTEITLPATGSTYTEVTYEWASDNACAVIADGKLTVTLPEEDAKVTITLTVKCGELTETKTYTMLVNSASTDVYVPEIVEAPVAGTGYAMVLDQKTLGKTFYFAGYMDGYYLATTDKADKGVTVFVEAVEGTEGAYRLYFMNGDTKTYIEVYERQAGAAGKGKGSVQLVTEVPATYYTYDATAKTFVVTSADGANAYYLGTYSSYNTFSVSNASYITGDKAATVDVSQFPARMATLAPATYVAEVAEAPAAGTGYVMVLDQKTLGKTFYFAGYMDGYYLATTDKADKGVTVFVEAVEGIEGAYRLYFMNGDTKTYIEVYERQAGAAGKGKGSVQLVTEVPATYYTYDATAKTFVVTSADGANAYYLGTYSNYNTFSVSNASYITGDKAATVDVSQFPARMATVKAVKVEPVIAETPVATTAYKMNLDQKTLGKTFYFAGYMDGYYLATTDKLSKAVDVYVEAVEGIEGAYRLYFMNGDTKTYIEVYERQAGAAGKGKGSVQLVTEVPTTYYTYDATAKTLVVTSADGANAYYLGTYSSYNTFSVSNASYITGDKAATVDVSQFPARLVTIEIVK